MKVALYLRVASADQNDNNVLLWQETRLREWAREQEHEVVAVFQDMAPGNTLDRPGLQALLSEINQNRFEAVAVHGFSRLVRETALALSLSETLENSGVKVFSSGESGDVLSGYTMVFDSLRKDYYQRRHSRTLRHK